MLGNRVPSAGAGPAPGGKRADRAACVRARACLRSLRRSGIGTAGRRRAFDFLVQSPVEEGGCALGEL